MLTAEHQTIRRLHIWNRFHIRLTTLYGVAVLVVLAAMFVVVYRLGFSTVLDGLRDRLEATAITLSTTLDVDGLAALDRDHPDVTSPAWAEVNAQLRSISERYPSLDSIYILRSTDEEGQLQTVMDVVREGEEDAGQLAPGEIYDASDLPVMLRGLREPAVERKPWEDEFGLSLSGYAPLVTSTGEPLGLVGMDVQVERIEAMKHKVLLLTLGLFGLAGLLLAVLAVFVGRNVSHPVTRIMAASSNVAGGNLKARVDLNRSDEFGLMGENFNQMAEGLEEREFIRDTFGRYVSEDVARALLETPRLVQLGGEERVVTVLLSDIRGYSTISEHLEPPQVVSLLNRYFGAMNEVIDRHQGCVIEYLGDGILAVFGAPNSVPRHPEQAVYCALAMRERLSTLNDEWTREGISKLWQVHGFDSLQVRVGIHTGSVVAGNLGSPSRMKYAVTGDTVNVASRLEQLNKALGTEILLSQTVYERLSGDLVARAVDMGSHHVKGRASEIHTYSI